VALPTGRHHVLGSLVQVYFSISGLAQEPCKCPLLRPQWFDGLLMTLALAPINLGYTKPANYTSTTDTSRLRELEKNDNSTGPNKYAASQKIYVVLITV